MLLDKAEGLQLQFVRFASLRQLTKLGAHRNTCIVERRASKQCPLCTQHDVARLKDERDLCGRLAFLPVDFQFQFCYQIGIDRSANVTTNLELAILYDTFFLSLTQR